MQEIRITVDIACCLVLIVVLYGTLLGNTIKDGKSIAFLFLVVSNIAAVLLDLLASFLDGNDSLSVLTVICKFLAMAMINVIAVVCLYYIVEIIKEKRSISPRHGLIMIGVNAVYIVFLAFLTAFGLLFTTEGGTVVYGDFFFIFPFSGFATLIYAEVLIIVCRKEIGLHDSISLLAYSILPVITFVFSLTPLRVEIGISSISLISLSILLIYVLLQSRYFSELYLREKYLNVISHTDTLTGLINRRGYNDALDEKNEGEPVCVMFSDLNGLKTVNDSKGHAAGDELLKKYGTILKKHFPIDTVYRISGDEFVVIFKEDKDDFLRRVSELRTEIAENGNIASVGTSYGMYPEIVQLVSTAEKDMYSEKRKFHLNNPGVKERRGDMAD